ncbi:MAG: tRNA (adenosine(37)-N6)-dimethylallyltransferase MiaA [Bacilli bacterium]|nr:tRNA (adenosine(37)-N6)-dimethylallyltransferase MiaA [Bacilli bacterium]
MNKIIVITGPTAVGKTKLSIELAKYFNGEIINADSTQVYKDLDIATAKITKKEKENIPHHLFDIKNIEEIYTVFDYQIDARKTIDDILKRNKTPILVGGTGLYIKAALYDYKFEEENKKNDYSNLDIDELYEKLLNIDPNTDIHKHNRKRVERAINYYEINNKPISEKEKNDIILYDAIFIGLTTDRETLYEKINNRVDVMVKSGLLEEAKTLYDLNIRTKAITTPIGYKELFDYFDNKYDLKFALELIKQRSRKYAKRQYTWFNNQMDIKWFNTDFDNFNNTVIKVEEYINNKNN